MIFVTVGTHEQGFDRLVKEVFTLVKEETIKENVFIQYGYSTPIENNSNIKTKMLLSPNEMYQLTTDCNIPITHGGPASFLSFLKINKVPIVVPRQLKYGEHINNHQLHFCERIVEEGYPIILVEDIRDLGNIIGDYDKLSHSVLKKSNRKFGNTGKFNEKLNCEIKKMLEGF